jgi:hypothetical protein
LSADDRKSSSILNFLELGFNWLIWIIQRDDLLVVLREFRWRDRGIKC